MSKSLAFTQDERDQFKIAWENCDRDALFALCNVVRRRWGAMEYDRAKFDWGWQYRTVLHERRVAAQVEFFNLCYGWW